MIGLTILDFYSSAKVWQNDQKITQTFCLQGIYIEKAAQPEPVRITNGQTNEVVTRNVYKFQLFDLQRANVSFISFIYD